MNNGLSRMRMIAILIMGLVILGASAYLGTPSLVSADDVGGIALPPPRLPSQGQDSTATTDTVSATTQSDDSAMPTLLKVMWDLVLYLP